MVKEEGEERGGERMESGRREEREDGKGEESGRGKKWGEKRINGVMADERALIRRVVNHKTIHRFQE